MIVTSRPRSQKRAVRRGIGYIGYYVMLAGLLLCTQVSCGGNTSDAEGIPSTGGTAAILPQTGWSLKFVDSQELVGSDGRGVNGFDGNTGTIWHTQWLNSQPPPPHEIQINLGSSANLNGFVYVPRQDMANGRIALYEFYVSTDGVNWGSPVATGTFANDATDKQVSFNPKTGQYVRLRALSEVNGKQYTSMAELRVLTATVGNQAPDSVISNPTSNVSIQAGGTVNFTGSGSDPDNNLPLSYLWNFGAGSGIPNSTAQNPGVVQFNNPGIYTVSFTVTDNLGLADPTPASIVITVGGSTLPNTNWTLKFVDSQELVGSDGRGVNGFDGNTGTIWHTQWLNSQPPPPHEIQINLGSSANLNGFVYVPRQDMANGRIALYEFYVSTDGVNWGSPVATGTFANDATDKQVSFNPKTGQYVRLRALSEVNGKQYTSMAELRLNGTTGGGGSNQAPNGVITNPTSNVSIQVGGTVNFTGSGSDPDNNLPLSYLWNFGAGSGVLASTAQNPGPVQFNNLGTFTTNFTVTDSLGLADPTPASAVITVNGSTLSNTSWSLQFVDSEELVGSDGRGVNGFDGDTGTIWHTQWLNGAPPPPHEIQINLGRSANLNGFVYVPRQDRSNGRIAQYEFYVSTDGVNWGSPVATGTFANTATGKQVSFAPTTGQYVRLRALSEVNGNPWTSMAELNLLGQCIAPAVKLAMPRSLNLQTSTTLNVVANACLDSVTQSGWGVRFVVDGGPAQGGAQVDTHTAPFQAQFSNLSLAEHRVEAFIIDNTGVQVAGTATQDQANPVGIGNYFVAMGDSITRGSRDDITSDNTSQDGRNTGGGYEPILNNLRTTAKHYPQTVVNEGVSNATSTDGVSLIPILLSRHPNAQYFLLLYGNSDSSVPVPSGSGLHPGDAGYPGTYKDNMQRIITAVKNAGKQPYLAKNPPAYNSFSARDPLIQAYNQVIDQLVAENNIMVIPPDFYTWFANHQNQLFDGDHPNGTGYQSMANLWQSALP